MYLGRSLGRRGLGGYQLLIPVDGDPGLPCGQVEVTGVHVTSGSVVLTHHEAPEEEKGFIDRVHF